MKYINKKTLFFVILITIAASYYYFTTDKNSSTIETVEITIVVNDSIKNTSLKYDFFIDNYKSILKTKIIDAKKQQIVKRKLSEEEIKEILKLVKYNSKTKDSINAPIRVTQKMAVEYYNMENKNELLNCLKK